MKHKIPKEIKKVYGVLKDAGYEAYLAGGCVRDLLLGKKPKDWDITTNARPEEIEEKTNRAVKEKSSLLDVIAKERVKDELVKIIMSDRPQKGLELMRETGVLKHVLPELEEGWGVTQNKEHIFKVWEHNLRSLEHAVRNKYDLEIRMAALLHDVGKPRAKRGARILNGAITINSLRNFIELKLE